MRNNDLINSEELHHDKSRRTSVITGFMRTPRITIGDQSASRLIAYRDSWCTHKSCDHRCSSGFIMMEFFGIYKIVVTHKSRLMIVMIAQRNSRSNANEQKLLENSSSEF